MTQSYYGSYSAFTNFLITIFSAHTNVNSFDIGEVDDYSVTGEDDYPRVFLELPIISEFDSNSLVWNCAFTVTKQTLLERDDEQAKINECWDIATDIMEALKDPVSVGYTAFSYNYLVNDNFNFTTLTRFKDDFTAGVRVELSIRQKNPVNLCDLKDSFNFIVPPEPPLCDFNLPINQINYNQVYCSSTNGTLSTDGWYVQTNTTNNCELLFRVYYQWLTTIPNSPQETTELYCYINGELLSIDVNSNYFDFYAGNDDQIIFELYTNSEENVQVQFYSMNAYPINVFNPPVSLLMDTTLKLNDFTC